jgi:hypothetical protein
MAIDPGAIPRCRVVHFTTAGGVDENDTVPAGDVDPRQYHIVSTGPADRVNPHPERMPAAVREAHPYPAKRL